MQEIPTQELQQLLNQLSQGNDKAFEQLYLFYKPRLHAFIYSKTRDQQASDELVQDVFMEMCRRPQGFNGSCNFTTWLCAIAKHRIVDHWRKQGRRPPEADVEQEFLEDIADLNAGIESFLEQEELMAVLQECIDQLPESQREAVQLVHLAGEKVEAVAQFQDCPEGTVKTRLHHARIKVRKCVENALGGGM